MLKANFLFNVCVNAALIFLTFDLIFTFIQSSHSFVISLNSPVRVSADDTSCENTAGGSFYGGGTYFPDYDVTVCPGSNH